MTTIGVVTTIMEITKKGSYKETSALLDGVLLTLTGEDIICYAAVKRKK